MNSEHRLWQEAVRRAVEAEVAPEAAAIDRDDRFPRAPLRALGEIGVLDLPAPDAAGEGARDPLAFAIALEEIARVSPATAWACVVHVSTLAALAKAAAPEARERALARLRGGAELATFAFTEPEAGSDFSAIRTRAERRGDTYVLEGRKCFISLAGEAAVYLVLARTAREDGSLAHSLFWVERDTPGFAVGGRHLGMGMRGIAWGELVLEGCRVPVGHRVGEEGRGLGVLFGMASTYLLGGAALSLGIAQGAFGETLRHLTERRRTPQDAPLADLEVLQFRVADLGARVEAIRSLVYRACAEEGGDGTLALAAKLFASEEAVEVAGAAQRLQGATGYASDAAIQRLVRDAFAVPLHFENNDFLRRFLGRSWLRP